VRKLFDRPERATPLLCAQGNETGFSVVWAKRRVFPGFLQRRRRLPSDFLFYDLQFRLR
jgi:hypothetical protein